MRPDLLTPAEAAVVASVTVRDVNRVIDEKILPADFYTVEGGRRVRRAACPMVGFYFRAARALTSEERLLIIRRYSERLGGTMPADCTVRDGFLSVDLGEFVAEADARAGQLAAAREMVVEDPAILRGTPVIRGTRIPVFDVAASLAAGLPRERILAAYSGLDETALDLALLYAEATPVRGRPRHPASLPAEAAIVAERKVARRHTA
jgi:uncharacterized protein (DUF433 family)